MRSIGPSLSGTDERPDRALDRRDFGIALAAMTLVVLASNILVQYPFVHLGLGDYLTWGAFTYPFSFLITDLSNRRFGPAGARRVVYAGFVLAVVLSVALATPRIAIASGAAFLVAQLLDIRIFAQAARPRLVAAALRVLGDLVGARHGAVLLARLLLRRRAGLGVTISEVLGAVGIADQCIALPWTSLAMADYGVKLRLAALSIAPYGAILAIMRPACGLQRRLTLPSADKSEFQQQRALNSVEIVVGHHGQDGVAALPVDGQAFHVVDLHGTRRSRR